MLDQALSRDELLDQVKRYDWFHAIDLGDGVVTPGYRSPLIAQAFDEIDFSQKKVLDVGCWDGLWSFEAEKRRASEVYATDYFLHRSYTEQPTFMLAHTILRSQVKYYPRVSVFDIHQLGVHDFDIVIFCGVYYHLRNPLLALTRLREVMNDTGIIIVEGEVAHDPNDTGARFYYRDWLKGDQSNWWIPTIPCLRQWMECSSFDIVCEYGIDGAGVSRISGEALELSDGRHAPSPRASESGRGRFLRRLRQIVGLPNKATGEEDWDPDRYLIVGRATHPFNRLAEYLSAGRLSSDQRGASGVGPDQLHDFFEAAADFYQHYPWRTADEHMVVKVEQEESQGRCWYAVVMGRAARTPGLALFREWDVLWPFLDDGFTREQMPRYVDALIVTYGHAPVLPSADLDAIQQHGWKVAGEAAYPLALHISRDTGLRRPEAAELELLAKCLRALPEFLTRGGSAEPRMGPSWTPVQGSSLSLSLWAVRQLTT